LTARERLRSNSSSSEAFRALLPQSFADQRVGLTK
jgi:hypothetical protein